MLVSPSIKPNGPYRFLVSPFNGLTGTRVFYGRFGLLWTIAGKVPLNLMQKACLTKAPITVDAEYLWRGATRDSLADFLNQHLSAEGIQQSRFIIMHGQTFLNHKISETGTAYHLWSGYAATNFRTVILSRCCCVRQRSYCICCCNQLSGLPPKPCERRMAISGEIPRRPLSNMESVFRDTARPLAASVTVSPSGLRHCRLITSPGCGGSCMSMA